MLHKRGHHAAEAGMFMWVKLLAGVVDADEILDDMKEAKVVVVPGKCPGFQLQAPQHHVLGIHLQ